MNSFDRQNEEWYSFLYKDVLAGTYDIFDDKQNNICHRRPKKKITVKVNSSNTKNINFSKFFSEIKNKKEFTQNDISGEIVKYFRQIRGYEINWNNEYYCKICNKSSALFPLKRNRINAFIKRKLQF